MLNCLFEFIRVEGAWSWWNFLKGAYIINVWELLFYTDKKVYIVTYYLFSLSSFINVITGLLLSLNTTPRRRMVS
jgi:hypothetical protein